MTALTANNNMGGAQAFDKAPLLKKAPYILRLNRISQPRQSSMPQKVDERGNPIPNRDYVFVDYVIVGGEHDGKEWSEIASWTLGIGPAGPSKLRQIVEGFMGRELHDGEACDPHDIAAAHPEAEVVVEQKPKEDGTKKNVTGSFIRATKPYVAQAAPAESSAELDEVPF